MLIRFTVENFMSFKTRQTISMVAGKHTRHSDHLAQVDGKRILKGSFIFGANAAGKSNLIKAIFMAQTIARTGLAGPEVERHYFRLDPEYAAKPGVFQFDLYSNGKFYSYGFAFSYSGKGILSEWLYRIKGSSEECVFERTVENGQSAITSESEFKDKETRTRFDIYGKDVSRSNTFLQEICSKELRDNPDFTAFYDVWSWLGNLIVVTPSTHLNVINKEGAPVESNWIRQFDTGIKSIVEKDISLDDIFRFTSEDRKMTQLSIIEKAFRTDRTLRKFGFTLNGNRYLFRLENNELKASIELMDHGNKDELFSYSEESDGTKRLFDILPIISSQYADRVILIDEIDRSFHTKLVIEFVSRFFEKTEGRNSQLIATLHDVNLMNLNILRQDEILFIFKNQESASEIYSLNKFQVRFDKDIIKDYLLGRYGSIPVFTQIPDEDNSDE